MSAPPGRFAARVVDVDPAAARGGDEGDNRTTTLTAMRADRIISHNDSPDVPFDASINPYQGCEHGCIYCYARPGHAYLDLSPGLDFETRIFYKPNAAERLEAQFARPGYECRPITIGANTDPYQPAEKKVAVTRRLLELFARCRHPVNIITKGTLILRDLDLLAELAAQNLCSVAVSVPTLDAELKRRMEPRVPSASARLNAIETLTDAGIPVSALVAPVIPAINDAEIESIVAAVGAAGAQQRRVHFPAPAARSSRSLRRVAAMPFSRPGCARHEPRSSGERRQGIRRPFRVSTARPRALRRHAGNAISRGVQAGRDRRHGLPAQTRLQPLRIAPGQQQLGLRADTPPDRPS